MKNRQTPRSHISIERLLTGAMRGRDVFPLHSHVLSDLGTPYSLTLTGEAGSGLYRERVVHGRKCREAGPLYLRDSNARISEPHEIMSPTRGVVTLQSARCIW